MSSVAELNPIVIDGNSFFDVIGNVGEWSSSKLASSVYLKGTGWRGQADSLKSERRNSEVPERRYNYIGLRLVRTLK